MYGGVREIKNVEGIIALNHHYLHSPCLQFSEECPGAQIIQGASVSGGL